MNSGEYRAARGPAQNVAEVSTNPFSSKEAFLVYASEQYRMFGAFDDGDDPALSAAATKWKRRLDAALSAREQDEGDG